MKITVCGDIHSDLKSFDRVLSNAKSHVVQVGDLGIGYHENDKYDPFTQFHCDYGWSFIHGNHDDPNLCNRYQNYLGRYHYDRYLNILYISGGYTPVKSQDNEYSSDKWVKEEQLNETEFQHVHYLTRKFRPNTIISHSCPYFIAKNLGFDQYSKTKAGLEKTYNIWQPKNWIFGHFHKDFNRTIVNRHSKRVTNFRCIPKNKFVEIEV